MEELCAQLSPADETESVLSLLEEAKRKINSALLVFRENRTFFPRSPCLIFEGCQLHKMSDTDMKALNQLFLHLCSVQDQRRWSTKSGYATKGVTAYRGVCSRRGKPSQNLVHRNSRTSNKCDCKASYTLFSNGDVVFRNVHADRCLPDVDMGNDGYVFNSGLSPTKKMSMISNVTDMFSAYGTTAVAARKQIEQSLVKSGDTGYGSGIV
jgi:hypothetical protein